MICAVSTAMTLDPLNEKWRKINDAKWDKSPALWRIITCIRDFMDGRALRLGADIESVFTPTVYNLMGGLAKATSSQELYDISLALTKEIMKEMEEQKQKESEGQGKSGEGESEEGQGEAGEETGEGKATQSGEGEPTGEGEIDFDDVQGVTDVHTLIKKDLEKIIEDLSKRLRKAKLNESRDFSHAQHVPVTVKHDFEYDVSKMGTPLKYADIYRTVRQLISSIKIQLEEALKVKENARWRTDRETGRLDTSRLYKVVADKNYTTPFKEFSKMETTNVAVQLVVDMSGSMWGEKMETAQQSCVALSEALGQLGIAHEIVGFDTSANEKNPMKYPHGSDVRRFNRFEPIRFWVIKKFSDNKAYGISAMHAGGNNVDGESLRKAAARLSQVPAKRKIMFVLSDGYPHCDGADLAILNSDLKKAVLEIEKFGIEVFSFGILTDAVKHFYKNYCVVNNIAELPAVIMKTLKKLLLRAA